jgi:enterochelin esterase family protein
MRILLCLLAASLSCTVHAQPAAQPKTPPPPQHLPLLAPDPVVHADRTVTFTYTDAAAKSVAVAIEGIAQPVPLTREAAGTWTYTSAAMQPEWYSYHFVVDGQYALDAHNVVVKAGVLNSGNGFLVPGATPEPWEDTAVPHGEVTQHRFTTHVVKGLERDQSQCVVYTPPGYDAKAPARYPVLYLLHGWSDLAGGWTSVGQANLILDNLIAEGKAKPMIVVMPLGYGEMSFVRKGWDEWQIAADIDRNTALFQQTLMDEVMPAVEHEYNIAPGREHHAIAGLSMGGLEALLVGLNHTGMFAYVGGFSSAVHMVQPPALSGLDPKTANLKLLWISCGTEDGLITANRKLAGYLKGEGLAVDEVETPGMHTWMVWRDNLVHFVPLLFQGQ